MPSQSTRVNITLPAELAAQLAEAVGPRGKSAFIAEAVQDFLDRRKREALTKELQEGYTANREERMAMVQEFEAVDLEEWDDDDATW